MATWSTNNVNINLAQESNISTASLYANADYTNVDNDSNNNQQQSNGPDLKKRIWQI